MSSNVDMPHFRTAFVLAALVHAVAAWFGTGFAWPDEHHQLIEFAETLRSDGPQQAPAWEYAARVRTTIQAVLCASMFGSLRALGVTDPFHLAFILRLLTAVFALWVTYRFVRVVYRSIAEDLRFPFVLLSYFLWFLPVLQVRFTGETWSGLLVLLGIFLVLGNEQGRAAQLKAGLAFGLAILFRPPVALVIAGVFAWLVFVQRIPRSQLMRMAVALVLTLLFGAVLDTWFYGVPTSALWNYFVMGASGAEAERFTALPWYQHLLFVMKYATVPIGLLILAAFGTLAWLRPRHLLVWTITPFLLLHMIVPVKEPRFLFPLAFLVPFLLMNSWQALREAMPGVAHARRWTRPFFAFLIGLNSMALLVAITTPAGNGRIRLAETMYRLPDERPVHLTYVGDWRIWIPPFYRHGPISETWSTSLPGPGTGFSNDTLYCWVVPERVWTSRSTALPDAKVLARAMPNWTTPLLQVYALEDAHDPLLLVTKDAR